jgi:NADH dehydrogenase
MNESNDPRGTAAAPAVPAPPFAPEEDAARRIVVVGGGFGGATLARVLQRRVPAGWTLVLVSEESYTTFNPMLPEAVGASVFPEHVVAPLREMIDVQRRGRFVMGRVTQVDPASKRLRCSTLAGPLEIGYGHLVLAFGSRARTDFLPGLAAHALPLKTVGDAMEIRNTVLRRLARIELEDDPARRARLGRFIVIGGGFSGVEVAGELVDCIANIRRYYPRVRREELGVTVVQDIATLLPELPAVLGRSAQRSLEKRGVDIRLNARAASIDAQGVQLASGARIDGETVICTVGTRPSPLAERLAQAGVAVERGRVVTGPDLAVAGVEGLWALGDCALVPNARDGQASPPTAQFAVRQAHLLADNLRARIEGRATRAFDYRAQGMMAAIGHMKGVAEVFGVSIGGLPAWLLWRAYYLMQMPTAGRKLRIFVEWSWGMFFPPDITHLRFQRSRDLDRAPPP